jgi:O-methyltransferase
MNLRPLKRSVEQMLARHPALFALASRIYHGLHHGPVNPGSAHAIREALAQAVDASESDKIGDYYEFGLFRGHSFAAAQEACRGLGLRDLRFHGFDSFQGLPAVEGIDRESTFFEGQFSCSRAAVEENLTRLGVDWSRTTLTEGVFSESLTSGLKRSGAFAPVGVAFIDCDLYTSTRDVLRWLDDLLVDGSIVVFDDWRCFDDRGDRGQQRAFREYLHAAGRRFDALPFLRYEHHGEGFLLRRRVARD